ncbi:hypothetical protein cyc_02205 [Cyclospora cayetanensis]|uniref:Uncharacterized protein n=1 Tax=Cyclospora cayetanensis TaxID=88456 RepID=A0A1D3D1R4_9EIME|nr:hypothetical protein cyc_02205 [Cyclospora cayetanensis]
MPQQQTLLGGNSCFVVASQSPLRDGSSSSTKSLQSPSCRAIETVEVHPSTMDVCSGPCRTVRPHKPQRKGRSHSRIRSSASECLSRNWSSDSNSEDSSSDTESGCRNSPPTRKLQSSPHASTLRGRQSAHASAASLSSRHTAKGASSAHRVFPVDAALSNFEAFFYAPFSASVKAVLAVAADAAPGIVSHLAAAAAAPFVSDAPPQDTVAAVAALEEAISALLPFADAMETCLENGKGEGAAAAAARDEEALPSTDQGCALDQLADALLILSASNQAVQREGWERMRAAVAVAGETAVVDTPEAAAPSRAWRVVSAALNRCMQRGGLLGMHAAIAYLRFLGLQTNYRHGLVQSLCDGEGMQLVLQQLQQPFDGKAASWQKQLQQHQALSLQPSQQQLRLAVWLQQQALPSLAAVLSLQLCLCLQQLQSQTVSISSSRDALRLLLKRAVDLWGKTQGFQR